jgi:hypothetical protein
MAMLGLLENHLSGDVALEWLLLPQACSGGAYMLFPAVRV